MGEVSRTKKVLALSGGGAFNTIALLISGMIAARVLSKHDYATMKQTLLVYNFAAPLLTLGLASALFYFLPKEHERKKGIILDTLLILCFMALLFSAFLFLGGSQFIAKHFDNPDLLMTLEWLIPYSLFVMPASILGAILVTQNKTYTLTIYNMLSVLLLAILTIAGTLFTRSYAGPLLAQIYFPVLLLPIVLWLSLKYVSGPFSFPKVASMKKILNYSVPLGFAGMLGTLTLMTDKIIVSAMGTPEEFANYVNGAIEIPLIGIITGSIASVILADMVKYIDEGNKKEALKLFKKAAVKSAVVLLPAMFFLLIVGKAFIVTLYSEKYLESVIPFYIYLFVLPMRIVVYGSAMMALGQTKVILFRSFFDLTINILLSILFVKIFGYLGAAIATILTLYLWTVPFNLYKIGQGFGVKAIETLPLKKVFIIMLLSFFASPLAIIYIVLNEDPYVLQFLIVAILYFPIVTILLYRFKVLHIPVKYSKYIPYFLKGK